MGAPRRPPARLRVPASTSNLGPGFDLIGLALALHLDVEARLAPGARSTLTAGAGCEHWPDAPANKLVLAYERGWSAFGEGPCPALELRARSEIPVSRGLGSSAAAIVAGLLLARHFSGRELSSAALLQHAVELEGHPDNVTPALFGGCTCTLPREGNEPLVVAQHVHPALAPVVAWPDRVMETAHARALLPAQVPFEDAVENARRLAVLLEGLRTGDAELLRAGAEDRLHVPYRVPAIPGARAALAAGLAEGAHLATLSGSGSALFALAARPRASAVARAMEAALAATNERAWSRVVDVVQAPPRVTPMDAAARDVPGPSIER